MKFLLCRIAIGSIPDNKIFIVFAEHESVKNSSLLHCLLALLSIQEYEGVWVKISASFNLFCQIWFPLLSTRNLSSWIQLQYVNERRHWNFLPHSRLYPRKIDRFFLLHRKDSEFVWKWYVDWTKKKILKISALLNWKLMAMAWSVFYMKMSYIKGLWSMVPWFYKSTSTYIHKIFQTP